MFSAFFNKIKTILRDKTLRNRILFLLAIFVLFRFLASIPVPGIDAARLQTLLSGNQFLGMLNLFSGGGLSTISIVLLGVGPYITASIIMQLLTMMSSRLKAMYQEEGDAGRKKFYQYARLLTIPLSIVQGLGFLLLLQQQGILNQLSVSEMMTSVITITGGSVLLMWLGELISEFGIGNGVSMLIFGGIVAQLPVSVGQILFNFDASQIPTILGFITVGTIIISGVVFITEAERAIPVTYAKQVRGNKVYGGVSTYLPLRINQAGVIPIIFALSILLLPRLAADFLGTLPYDFAKNISSFFVNFLNQGFVYGAMYFFLVVLFTYFYTAVTFDPDAIAKNLQRSGAFIPGVRPGESTAKHLSRVITRTTFVGALFLGLIAVLPLIVQYVFNITALSIGGTALLIVVSVVIDLIKKVDAQTSMREY